MKDTRKEKLNMPIHGKKVSIAAYPVNEETIKEMLANMGVKYDDKTVQEAIGYFSMHGMQINMNNLADFLKQKNILHDFRKKTKKD